MNVCDLQIQLYILLLDLVYLVFLKTYLCDLETHLEIELNDIWRYLTIIWRYLTTETFTLEPENYRPKDIVKYRHLSPSGNRALEREVALLRICKFL